MPPKQNKNNKNPNSRAGKRATSKQSLFDNNSDEEQQATAGQSVLAPRAPRVTSAAKKQRTFEDNAMEFLLYLPPLLLIILLSLLTSPIVLRLRPPQPTTMAHCRLLQMETTRIYLCLTRTNHR